MYKYILYCFSILLIFALQAGKCEVEIKTVEKNRRKKKTHTHTAEAKKREKKMDFVVTWSTRNDIYLRRVHYL